MQLLGAGGCPRAGGRAAISFLGSRRSSRKPLPGQTSLLKVLTLWAATWIARLTSSMTKPFLLSCGKSVLARNCRAEKAGSSLGQQGRDHPWQKAGGSPRRTHQAIRVGTEPSLRSFAPTDIRVSLCPATQHACWRGESKRRRDEHLCGAGEVFLRDRPQGPALSLPSWLKDRAGAFAEEGSMAGTGAPAGAHSPAWAPLAEERRDPAPRRLGSSCLPLPPVLAARRLPRQALCQPWAPVGRDALLSPCSFESGSCCFIANMVHVDGERLEILCPSRAGVSPPDAPLPTLREQRDMVSLQHRPRSPEV